MDNVQFSLISLYKKKAFLTVVNFDIANVYTYLHCITQHSCVMHPRFHLSSRFRRTKIVSFESCFINRCPLYLKQLVNPFHNSHMLYVTIRIYKERVYFEVFHDEINLHCFDARRITSTSTL